VSDNKVYLRWSGEDLRFEGGRPDGPSIQLDSAGEAGPSPMDALLLGVAGCMGIDVAMILEKGRTPLTSLEVDVEGDRSSEVPRRFTAIRIRYLLGGLDAGHHEKARRAVDLSREKYCSVLHSLRPDVDLEIRIDYV